LKEVRTDIKNWMLCDVLTSYSYAVTISESHHLYCSTGDGVKLTATQLN